MRIATLDLTNVQAPTNEIIASIRTAMPKLVVLNNAPDQDDLDYLVTTAKACGYTMLDRTTARESDHDHDITVLRSTGPEEPEPIEYGDGYFGFRIPLTINRVVVDVYAIQGSPHSETDRYLQFFDLAELIKKERWRPAIIIGHLGSIPIGSVPWRIKGWPLASKSQWLGELARPCALEVLETRGFPVYATVPTTQVKVNSVFRRVRVATSHILARGAEIQRMYLSDYPIRGSRNQLLVADVTVPSQYF